MRLQPEQKYRGDIGIELSRTGEMVLTLVGSGHQVVIHGNTLPTTLSYNILGGLDIATIINGLGGTERCLELVVRIRNANSGLTSDAGMLRGSRGPGYPAVIYGMRGP